MRSWWRQTRNRTELKKEKFPSIQEAVCFLLFSIPNVLFVCYERQREKMILNIPQSFNYFSPLSELEIWPWGQRWDHNGNEAQEQLDENTHCVNEQKSKWKKKGNSKQRITPRKFRCLNQTSFKFPHFFIDLLHVQKTRTATALQYICYCTLALLFLHIYPTSYLPMFLNIARCLWSITAINLWLVMWVGTNLLKSNKWTNGRLMW